MAEADPTHIVKRKAPMDNQDVDFKEVKTATGRRASYGINLRTESMEDIYRHINAGSFNLYSRRGRTTVGQNQLDESRNKSAAKQTQEQLPSEPIKASGLSKGEELYQRWTKAGLNNFSELPSFTPILSEEDIKDLESYPPYEIGPKTFRHLNSIFQDRVKGQVSRDMRIDAEDRRVVAELAEMAGTALADYIEKDQQDLHKFTILHEAKYDNPLNVYQKDRKKVIDHIAVIVDDIQKSLNEVAEKLGQETYKELDAKLDESLQKLKIESDTGALCERFDQITKKQLYTFSQEFDPVFDLARRNEAGMHEVFLEYLRADKILAEAEQKVHNRFGKNFLENLKESSIEVMNGYLSPN